MVTLNYKTCSSPSAGQRKDCRLSTLGFTYSLSIYMWPMNSCSLCQPFFNKAIKKNTVQIFFSSRFALYRDIFFCMQPKPATRWHQQEVRKLSVRKIIREITWTVTRYPLCHNSITHFPCGHRIAILKMNSGQMWLIATEVSVTVGHGKCITYPHIIMGVSAI